MAVSNLVLKYQAKGADRVRRADKKVSRQSRKTAKQAEQDQKSTNRWMQRNRGAINAMAGATMGFLGGLLYASPRVRAQLEAIKTIFGAWADEIIREHLPFMNNLVGMFLKIKDVLDLIPDSVMDVLVPVGLMAGLFSVLVAVGGKVASVLGVSGILGAAGALAGPLGLILAIVIGMVIAWGNLRDRLSDALQGVLMLLSPVWFISEFFYQWAENGWGVYGALDAVLGVLQKIGRAIQRIPIIGDILSWVSNRLGLGKGVASARNTFQGKFRGGAPATEPPIGGGGIGSTGTNVMINNEFSGLFPETPLERIREQIRDIANEELGDEARMRR